MYGRVALCYPPTMTILLIVLNVIFFGAAGAVLYQIKDDTRALRQDVGHIYGDMHKNGH